MFTILRPGTQCRCTSFPSPVWTTDKQINSILIRTMDITEGKGRQWLFRLQFESFQGRHRLVFKRPTLHSRNPLWEWTKEEEISCLSAILQPHLQVFYPHHALWVIVVVGYEENKQWKTKQFTFHVLSPSELPFLNLEFRTSLDRVSSTDRWKKWDSIVFCSLFSPKHVEESDFQTHEMWKYEPAPLIEGQQRMVPPMEEPREVWLIPEEKGSSWKQVLGWVRRQLPRWVHEPKYMIEQDEEQGIFQLIVSFFDNIAEPRLESCIEETP